MFAKSEKGFALSLKRLLLACPIVLILAAVKGPSFVTSARVAQNSFDTTGSPTGQSWMSPEAKNEDLLYVSDQEEGTSGSVLAFSYPQGKLVGTLIRTSEDATDIGLCSDKSGNIWITGFPDSHAIAEYPHAGVAPIAVLHDTDFLPIDCAVDPITGNVAVTNAGSGVNARSGGNLPIYFTATGTPSAYISQDIVNYGFCTYDASGNLYVTTVGHEAPKGVLLELPKDASRPVPVTVDRPITWPSVVRWDGKYLALEAPRGPPSTYGSTMIYQVKALGTTLATVVNTIELSSGEKNRRTLLSFGFWVQDQRIIQVQQCASCSGDLAAQPDVQFWQYPKGGIPTETIHTDKGFLEAVMVSLAPLHP